MRYEAPDLRTLDYIEDLLEAYADARLTPTSPVLARMRANVMSQAHTVAANAQRVQVAETPAPRRFAFAPPQLPRRAFALGLAAALTLGTSAAVFAAPPGSPFYNARLVIESAMLPPVSRPVDRLAAFEEHLATRIAEARAAAASGNAAALAAALAAYQSEVDALVAEAGLDADQLAHLEEMLAKHTAVLETLEAQVPEQASVDKAIETSEKAIEKIKDKAAGSQGGGRPSQPAGGQPDGQGQERPNRD
jgi:hypothetical protein